MQQLNLRLAFFILANVLLAPNAQAIEHEVAALGSLRFNTPTIENVPGYSYKATPGFSAGALYFMHFSPRIAVRAGVLYTTRSADLDYTGALGTPAVYNNYEFTVSTSYVDIPFGVQYTPFEFPAYVFAGGTFAWKISESCEEAQDYYNVYGCVIGRTKYDVLVQIGVGYDIVKFDFGKVGLEAHYEYGVLDVDDTPTTTPFSPIASTYNRGFAISAVGKYKF